MKIETGQKKWETCQDHVLVDAETAGIKQPILACRNLGIQELARSSVWIPSHDSQTDEMVAMIAVGKQDDVAVQRALSRVCGPCRYYSNCDQKTS